MASGGGGRRASSGDGGGTTVPLTPQSSGLGPCTTGSSEQELVACIFCQQDSVSSELAAALAAAAGCSAERVEALLAEQRGQVELLVQRVELKAEASAGEGLITEDSTERLVGLSEAASAELRMRFQVPVLDSQGGLPHANVTGEGRGCPWVVPSLGTGGHA